MTIDEAIVALTKMRAQSRLGGQTCLAVCLVDSEVADSNVSALRLDQDSDGALVLVMVEDHELRA